MERDTSLKKIIAEVPSPCYLIDKAILRHNLEILASVKERTGCRMLHALKAFACWSVADMISEHMDGTNAASLFEARLGRECFDGEVHVCCPAYTEEEIEALTDIADHVVFNSVRQFSTLAHHLVRDDRDISVGLRVNPMHSEVEVRLYDPCAAGSRLGVTRDQLEDRLPDRIDGLHFHTLCEKNADSLQRTLKSFEQQFSCYFGDLQWVNFGGGHHITRPDYEVDLLCELVSEFKTRYCLQVYLEPGEATALNAGFLIATVLDIVHSEIDIAILDTSATAHMPDVLEMPYRPRITGGAEPGEKRHTYRLAGRTCLAGDVIGDYSFDEPLDIGDRLIFHDMAHYTIVKNTMFNGLNLPDIVLFDSEAGRFLAQRRFTYEDYKSRQG